MSEACLARKRMEERLYTHSGGRRADEWKTINGTHVEVDKHGNIIKGPYNLKRASTKNYSIPKGSTNPKLLKKIGRDNLEFLATQIFINENTKRGLTEAEADYRARSLMSGNTDNQLIKYIVKYGKQYEK